MTDGISSPFLSRRRFLVGTAAAGLAIATGCGRKPSIPTSIVENGSLPSVIDWKVTRWESDQWSRGSYSYIPAGSSSLLRLDLARPTDGRRFMAGEATEENFPATVNGAIRTGKRAATEVLQARGISSCIVVGAGAAGLSAGSQLLRAGCTVTVLEGRDRIGGRAWTDDVDGSQVDLGGSWFHGVNTHTLTPRAKELDVRLIPTNYENAVLFNSRGTQHNWSKLEKLYTFVYDSVLSKASKESMGVALIEFRRTLSAEEKQMLDYIVVSEIEHEYGAHVDNLAMLAATEGARPIGGDAIPENGYGQFMDDLSNELTIKLSTSAESISHDDSGVTITTSNEIFRADSVVVTLPLGVLQSGTVRFTPELSTRNQAAVKGLGMGLLNKLVVKFKEPFWDVTKDLIGYIPDDRGHFVEWYNAVPWTGQPILVGFNAAETAKEVETWDDISTLQAGLDVLSKMKF